MFYVYRLKSQSTPNFSYTGYTTNLKRLAEHNRGQVTSTAKHAPYDLIFYAAFDNARSARNFEDSLKTGSGKAFGSKRLWPADHSV